MDGFRKSRIGTNYILGMMKDMELTKENSELNQSKAAKIALLLVLGSAFIHVAYLLFFCPLCLAPDEAHYFDWSRHLDWSYYSKGPLVAWMIRAGLEVFGPLSLAISGSEMPAVRIPAVFCGTLLLWGSYVLAQKVFQKPKISIGVLIIAISLPPISAASSIMTIDAPFTCAWIWSLIFGYMAIFESKNYAWIPLGFTIGIGILAKYTMVLWIASLVCFFLFSSSYRQYLFHRGPWVMGAIAAFCCLPILIWNIQNGWVSFHHVSALAGLHDGPKYKWYGPLVYIGQQFGLLLGYWFVVWATAMWRFRPTVDKDPKINYLWWMSAGTFLVFLAFSPKTGGGEINWPVTSYLSGLMLVGYYIYIVAKEDNRFLKIAAKVLPATFVTLGLLLSLCIHRSEIIRPLLSAFTGPASQQNPFPLRKLDPTCRLRGWDQLGKEVDKILASIRASDGVDPILFGGSWNVPGELGFYCKGHPQAYSIGLANGDRHSQYDLWTNPIDHPEKFLGKNFLVVGIVSPEAQKAFEEVVELPSFLYKENGNPIGIWYFHYCKGFKGFEKHAGGRNF